MFYIDLTVIIVIYDYIYFEGIDTMFVEYLLTIDDSIDHIISLDIHIVVGNGVSNVVDGLVIGVDDRNRVERYRMLFFDEPYLLRDERKSSMK